MMFGYSDGKTAGPSWALAMAILLGILMVAGMAQPAATGQQLIKQMSDGDSVYLWATAQDENTPFGQWFLQFLLARGTAKPNQEAIYTSTLKFSHSLDEYQVEPPETSVQCTVNSRGGNVVLLDIPMTYVQGDIYNVVATINLQWKCGGMTKSTACETSHFILHSGTTALDLQRDQSSTCQDPVFTGQVLVKIDDVEYMGKVDQWEAVTFKYARLRVLHA